MTRKRGGVGGWVSRLTTARQAWLFVGLAAGAGSILWGGLAGLERRTGILAEQFGFARAVEVADSVGELQAWQLYTSIRSIRRQIADMGPPKTEKDRERFDDLTEQLGKAQAAYDRLLDKDGKSIRTKKK